MSPEPALAVVPATPVAFRAVALAPVPTQAATIEHERARTAGYAAGWAAGARAAAEAAQAQARRHEEAAARAEAARQAAFADALEVLGRAVAAASSRTVPVLDEARRTVHEAALALAEAVLGGELAPGPRSARAVLDRALALPLDLGVHTVRLHPADLAAVEAELAAHPGLVPDGVRLVADPRLGPGDAISEHPTGFLDAQIGSALDRARSALLGDESGEVAP